MCSKFPYEYPAIEPLLSSLRPPHPHHVVVQSLMIHIIDLRVQTPAYLIDLNADPPFDETTKTGKCYWCRRNAIPGNWIFLNGNISINSSSSSVRQFETDGHRLFNLNKKPSPTLPINNYYPYLEFNCAIILAHKLAYEMFADFNLYLPRWRLQFRFLLPGDHFLISKRLEMGSLDFN